MPKNHNERITSSSIFERIRIQMIEAYDENMQNISHTIATEWEEEFSFVVTASGNMERTDFFSVKISSIYIPEKAKKFLRQYLSKIWIEVEKKKNLFIESHQCCYVKRKHLHLASPRKKKWALNVSMCL